ncbi:MAG: GDCCVxC domain-containing (seleno)protein [bacterium]
MTCFLCHHQTVESMPSTGCLHFFECPSCCAMLRPRPGAGCVYYRYSDCTRPPNRSPR